MRITPSRINYLNSNEIFVFGSNMAGSHGGGAAYQALQNGWAKPGKGYGLVMADDRSGGYAIPTLGFHLESISLKWIKYHVDHFIEFAIRHQNLHFYVTALGCGIAGLQVSQIAPMFKGCDKMGNMSLPREFLDYFKAEKDAARIKRQSAQVSKIRGSGISQAGNSISTQSS